MHGRSVLVSFVIALALIAIAQAQERTGNWGAAIEKHRKGELLIEAPPGTEITVEQQRHGFWFGADIASQACTGRLRSENRENCSAP
jgi:hypothetical protein